MKSEETLLQFLALQKRSLNFSNRQCQQLGILLDLLRKLKESLPPDCQIEHCPYTIDGLIQRVSSSLNENSCNSSYLTNLNWLTRKVAVVKRGSQQ